MRPRPFEPLEGVPGPLTWPRLDQPPPPQDPVDRRHRRHRQPFNRLAQQLHPNPLGAPSGMRTPHLPEPNLHLRRDLIRAGPRTMRPIGQPADPVHQIPPGPGMQRLPRHPDLSSHLGDFRTRQHCPNRIQPLLDHRQRNQCQSRPPARRRPTERRRSGWPNTARPLTRSPRTFRATRVRSGSVRRSV